MRVSLLTDSEFDTNIDSVGLIFIAAHYLHLFYNMLLGAKGSVNLNVVFISIAQMFQELDEDQLKSLPALSAAVVSQEQLSHLSASQQLALRRVQTQVPTLKYSEHMDTRIKQNHEPNGSASSMGINLLVIVALGLISRFSA
jgi:hypothetical protein